MSTPPADRFRVGDVWRSPRGKHWQCDKVKDGMARLRSVRNPQKTHWRHVRDTGADMLSAWERIVSTTQPDEN